MTDKDKIRAEVERLQKELIQEKEKGFGSDADDACILELQNVLTYIDSLQEEPVSEDLEEAASKYAKEEYRRKSPEILPDRCIGCYAPLMYAFKAGANWREEQIMNGAVDGEVGYWNLHGLSVNVKLPHDVEEGDKAKVLIIKQE